MNESFRPRAAAWARDIATTAVKGTTAGQSGVSPPALELPDRSRTGVDVSEIDYGFRLGAASRGSVCGSPYSKPKELSVGHESKSSVTRLTRCPRSFPVGEKKRC